MIYLGKSSSGSIHSIGWMETSPTTPDIKVVAYQWFAWTPVISLRIDWSHDAEFHALVDTAGGGLKASNV